MRGKYWTCSEVDRFLELDRKGIPATGIACGLGRTPSAIHGMRRKLRRLRELGASEREIPKLLHVNDSFVQANELAEIRARANHDDLVPVRPFVRRSSTTGELHLVEQHARNREING
jgi:hypothetical protein